jgi:hypothetical protein
MANFDTTPKDTITIDTAGEIDAAWTNSGMPQDGLRITGHRVSGNRSVTLLTVPGDNSAPCYTLSNGRYIHVTGPTLGQWYAEQDAADLRDTQRCAF